MELLVGDRCRARPTVATPPAHVLPSRPVLRDRRLAVDEEETTRVRMALDAVLELIEGRRSPAAGDDPGLRQTAENLLEQVVKPLAQRSLEPSCLSAALDIDDDPAHQRTPPSSPLVHSSPSE